MFEAPNKAKEELMEIVDFLKAPERFVKAPCRASVLLVFFLGGQYGSQNDL